MVYIVNFVCENAMLNRIRTMVSATTADAYSRLA
jgi:hypothetical protein